MSNWKSIVQIGLVAMVPLLGACGKTESTSITTKPAPIVAPRVNGARAFEEVKQFVAVGPRVSGTPGQEKGARYLYERLIELGLRVKIDTFTETTPRGNVAFQNVIGTLAGASEDDRIVIFGSHYDTKAGISDDFIGANDSGSSSGLLLEMARVLKEAGTFKPEIRFAFFDGEECFRRYGPHDGFHGSQQLAQQLVQSGEAKRVIAVIVLDMIGDQDLSVTLPKNSTPSLVSATLQAAHEENARSHFTLLPHAIGDDHVPFLRAGMPAIDLIDFEFGSAPGKNDYWHTPQDTLDKISPHSLEIIGNVALRLCYKIIK